MITPCVCPIFASKYFSLLRKVAQYKRFMHFNKHTKFFCNRHQHSSKLAPSFDISQICFAPIAVFFVHCIERKSVITNVECVCSVCLVAFSMAVLRNVSLTFVIIPSYFYLFACTSMAFRAVKHLRITNLQWIDLHEHKK